MKIIDVGIFFISLKYLFPFIFYLSGGKTYHPTLVYIYIYIYTIQNGIMYQMMVTFMAILTPFIWQFLTYLSFSVSRYSQTKLQQCWHGRGWIGGWPWRSQGFQPRTAQCKFLPSCISLICKLIRPERWRHFMYLVLCDLMFFWPCIMNWLYINYQLDALTIIYS